MCESGAIRPRADGSRSHWFGSASREELNTLGDEQLLGLEEEEEGGDEVGISRR